MKQGVAHPLYVTFSNISMANINQATFYFKNFMSQECSVLKKSVYKSDGTGDCTIENNKIKIPWTSAETYKFKGEFFLDTRLKLTGDAEEKEIAIVTLFMNPTIISEAD